MILTEQLKEYGFHIESRFLSSDVVDDIIAEVATETMQSSIPSPYGIRQAHLKFPLIQQLVHSSHCIEKAQALLGNTPQLVRVILFDKTPDSNWLVAWHQDKTIAVRERIEVNGWGPWTIKDGVHHVQPSRDILEQMITFRIHLDDADRNNGCLKVIPRSHQHGFLTADEISRITESSSPHFCEVLSGDALFLKPLVLHASSKSKSSSHRRVIHIEYCSATLPNVLKWC